MSDLRTCPHCFHFAKHHKLDGRDENGPVWSCWVETPQTPDLSEPNCGCETSPAEALTPLELDKWIEDYAKFIEGEVTPQNEPTGPADGPDDNCVRHGSPVCEPCAYDRGHAAGLAEGRRAEREEILATRLAMVLCMSCSWLARERGEDPDPECIACASDRNTIRARGQQ